MSKEKDAVTLKLTSAVALDGQVFKAGSTVEVDDAIARNLLHRGKAALATEGKRTKVDDKPTEPTEAQVLAHILKAENMDEPAFLALSDAKRAALTKQAIADLKKAA